jgi:hypothetical protein
MAQRGTGWWWLTARLYYDPTAWLYYDPCGATPWLTEDHPPQRSSSSSQQQQRMAASTTRRMTMATLRQRSSPMTVMVGVDLGVAVKDCRVGIWV